MPPKSKYASVKTYFGSLLSYAKYVVEQLPGEVIPQKSLSDSSLRRESWRKIIEHGRQLGVPNLPNPESIDSWFPHFKDFKRVHGLKNLQPFGGLQSNKRFGPSIQEKDTTFERLLRELNGEELSSAGEEFEDSDSDSDESEAKSEMSDLSATENESSSSESSSSDSDYDSSASDDDNEIRRRSVPKIDLTLQTPVNARPKSKRPEVITLSSSPYPIPQNDVHKPMTIKLKIPQDPAVQIPPPQKIHQIQPTSVASQHQSIRPQSRKIPSHEKKIHQLTAQVSELSVQDSPISTTSDDPSSDLDTMHTPVELIKLLAAGGQAAVFLARLPLDGNSLIVVKVFYSPPSPFEVRSMKAVSLTTYAIRLLGQTRIPISNLVKYRQALTEHEVDISQFELIDSKNVLGFCYERLQGDLESVIISAERKVGNCTKMLVALQIGYFLRGIHAANYIFRDLKPSNILINSPLENMTPEQVLHCFLQNLPLIKVTDFGLVTQSKCRRKTKSAGTIGYMPFEQMTTNTYDKKVDVVAYGITIFELMTDNLLYDISESDEAVEEEFRTLRVIDRMKRRLHLSSRHFHPALIRLIIESVEGRFSNVEPFIQYFEEQFNLLCFVYGKKKHELHLVLPELQRSY